MCGSESDFSDVRVGDKLWSVQLGECEVNEIVYSGRYKIFCNNGDGINGSYTIDGKNVSTDINPSLFWSRPEIIAAARPKRKVVKTVEAWANVFRGENARVHRTYEEARSQCHTWPDGLIRGCIRLTGTYEVFE